MPAVLALLAITVAGCVLPNPGPRGASASPERCRVDTNESGPLIFFCIESP